jgi:hypothetical protein
MRIVTGGAFVILAVIMVLVLGAILMHSLNTDRRPRRRVRRAAPRRRRPSGRQTPGARPRQTPGTHPHSQSAFVLPGIRGNRRTVVTRWDT